MGWTYYNVYISTPIFQQEVLKITTGIRYLGGFLGSEEDETNYIGIKVENWVKSVEPFSHTSEK